MAQKGCQNVVIKGADDKRSITSTFAITLAGEFLPMQLIYGGKTLQSLPRYKFPDSFSLSVNETHYSNRKESVKLLEEIIIPYVEAVRTSRQLDPNQKALMIMDVSTGQMTSEVLDLLEDSNILVTNQPLDLTVNRFVKRFMSRKFNDWYTDQVSKQMDNGVKLEDIDVKLRLVYPETPACWLVSRLVQPYDVGRCETDNRKWMAVCRNS